MLRYLLPAEMKPWNRESHPCAATVNPTGAWAHPYNRRSDGNPLAPL